MRNRQRRLSFTLADLMVAVLTVALMVRLLQLVQPQPRDDDHWNAAAMRDEFRRNSIVVGCAYFLPAYATVWASTLGWRKNSPFPREPGHWLLIQVGAAFAERAVSLALGAGLIDGSWHGCLWPLCWLPTLVLSWVAIRKSLEPAWKLAFQMLFLMRASVWVLLLLAVVVALLSRSSQVEGLPVFVLLVAIVLGPLGFFLAASIAIAVQRDALVNVLRGKVHIMGVGIFLLEPVMLGCFLLEAAIDL